VGSRETWLALFSDTRVMVTLLAGAVVAFAAVAVVLISNAAFTVSSNSGANSFSAGTIGLTLSKSGPIVDAANLRRGQSRSGDIEVTNTREPGVLSVTPTGFPDTSPLAQGMQLKITPQGQPANVFSNAPLAPAKRIVLGPQGSGAVSAWTFELTLRPDAAPDLGGTSLDASFEWEVRSK